MVALQITSHFLKSPTHQILLEKPQRQMDVREPERKRKPIVMIYIYSPISVVAV